MACSESHSLIRAIEAACAASPAGADLLVTTFVISLQSYRRPSVCRPFPSSLFTLPGPLPDKDFPAALRCCAHLPPIAAIANASRAPPPCCQPHATHAPAAHAPCAARDDSDAAACPCACGCSPAAAAPPWHSNMPMPALRLLAWVLSPLMPSPPSLSAAQGAHTPTLHHAVPQDKQQQQDGRAGQQGGRQQGRLHVVQVGDVQGTLAKVLTSWQMGMLTSSPAAAGGRNVLPQGLVELVTSSPPTATAHDPLSATSAGGMRGSGDGFEAMARAHGSVMAFHGTPSENMHGILRCGLLNLSRTALQRNGSMHGEGIYLSTDPTVAFTFSQASDATHALPSLAPPSRPPSSSTGSLSPAPDGWRCSELGAAPRFVLLCEVITGHGVRCSAPSPACGKLESQQGAQQQAHGERQQQQQQQQQQQLGTYVVVENPCMLRIRYIMVYTTAPATPPLHPSSALAAGSPVQHTVPASASSSSSAAAAALPSPGASPGSFSVHAGSPASVLDTAAVSSTPLPSSLPCTQQRLLEKPCCATHLASLPAATAASGEAACVQDSRGRGRAECGGESCGACESVVHGGTGIGTRAVESQSAAQCSGVSRDAGTATGGAAGPASVRREGVLALSEVVEGGERMGRVAGDGLGSRDVRQGNAGSGQAVRGRGTFAPGREVRRRGHGGQRDACVNLMAVYAVLLLAVGLFNSRVFWVRIWPVLEGILGQQEEF
ncbi:unnamed protein product [Closterium sp. NIES-53]